MFSHINKNEHYCYTRIKYRIENINKNIIQIYNYIYKQLQIWLQLIKRSISRLTHNHIFVKF